jgi:hypothetical protein
MGFGSMFGRAAVGAMAGYGLTGDWGGAAAGAGMAGVGWGMMSKFGNGLGASKYAQRGVGLLGRGASLMQKGGMQMFGTRLGRMGMPTISAGMAAERGLGKLGGFLGKHALATNRYAGYAMAGMGVGASAYIGSSIINSNRGY